MSDVVQQMFESFPEDELLEFDSFFIGDGSKALMNKNKSSSKVNHNNQLTGIFSVDDLSGEDKEAYSDILVNDLFEFIPELNIEQSIEDYFCSVKKSVFDLFGFLEIKSKRLEGRPFREIDLLISSEDKYLLTYLKNSGVNDYGIYNAIAQLKALNEIGFIEVRFVQKDCCPICEAYAGQVYNIDYAISVVCSGKYLIHENCICKFVPVIRDRSLYTDQLNINIESVYVGDILVENLPLEYEEELFDLISQLDCETVVFKSYSELSEISDIKCLIFKEENILYVCNEYLGSYSLLDYITFWVSESTNEADNDSLIEEKISSGDVYYLNGKRVVELDGRYFDIETKERIS